MARVAVYKSTLESARDRGALTDAELELVRQLIEKVPSGMQRVEMDDYPHSFLRALLEDSKLKPNQRAAIALQLHGLQGSDLELDALYSLEVAGPLEFGSALTMGGRQKPNVELSWNGRWYPVIATAAFQEDESKLAKIVRIVVNLDLGARSHGLAWFVDPGIFLDENGNPKEVTILKVLEQIGLRRLQHTAGEHNLRLVRAERLIASHGAQIWIKGKVLDLNMRFWFVRGLSERALGTTDVPRRGVVEPTLGIDEENANSRFYANNRPGEGDSRMPLVRVFSFDIKSYVYLDIDDLEIYEYDIQAIRRLVLPDKMKGILTQLFSTPTDQLFGDIVRGKHGGIVILASSNPGVGKTLTAEVYAEIAQRPLYVLEFGELGTTVESIEKQLAAVFARVVRWQAVLQFDECEIFLGQRGENLERSAIVGIFLRMLDYYEGLLFLTTNRPEAMDYAIRSRVMLRLEYPDLDNVSRERIWRTMFDSAGIRLLSDSFSELAKSELNGRQIRNLVRLARILHPGGAVTLEDMVAIIQFGCR